MLKITCIPPADVVCAGAYGNAVLKCTREPAGVQHLAPVRVYIASRVPLEIVCLLFWSFRAAVSKVNERGCVGVTVCERGCLLTAD